jgi:hypothetical protein
MKYDIIKLGKSVASRPTKSDRKQTSRPTNFKVASSGSVRVLEMLAQAAHHTCHALKVDKSGQKSGQFPPTSRGRALINNNLEHAALIKIDFCHARTFFGIGDKNPRFSFFPTKTTIDLCRSAISRDKSRRARIPPRWNFNRQRALCRAFCRGLLS